MIEFITKVHIKDEREQPRHTDGRNAYTKHTICKISLYASGTQAYHRHN
jgi:hypothetical protein